MLIKSPTAFLPPRHHWRSNIFPKSKKNVCIKFLSIFFFYFFAAFSGVFIFSTFFSFYFIFQHIQTHSNNIHCKWVREKKFPSNTHSQRHTKNVIESENWEKFPSWKIVLIFFVVVVDVVFLLLDGCRCWDFFFFLFHATDTSHRCFLAPQSGFLSTLSIILKKE